jgi:hypothetical protein
MAGGFFVSSASNSIFSIRGVSLVAADKPPQPVETFKYELSQQYNNVTWWMKAQTADPEKTSTARQQHNKKFPQ